MWVFFFYKYGKFWSILPDKKVDLKPLFSEECLTKHDKVFSKNCNAKVSLANFSSQIQPITKLDNRIFLFFSILT